jgi:ERCC4-type nuclease
MGKSKNTNTTPKGPRDAKKRNVEIIVSDPVLASLLPQSKLVERTFAADVTWLLDGIDPFGVPITIKREDQHYENLLEKHSPYMIIAYSPTPVVHSGRAKQRICDIIVTSGETKLMAEFVKLQRAGEISPNASIIQRNLRCGDVAIVEHGSDEVVWIGERKDKNDFVASIIDRRHHTQQAVMLEQNIRSDRICYLIEGFPLKVARAISAKSIAGSLVYPLIRHGFNTIMTDNIRETAVLVATLHDLFESAPAEKFLAPKNMVMGNALNAGKKKSDLTERDEFIGMLTRVRRVSDEVAEAIAAVYPTISDLQIAFLEHDISPELMLQDVVVNSKSGGSRRVGPELSRGIYAYFRIANLKEYISGNTHKRQKLMDDDDDGD